MTTQASPPPIGRPTPPLPPWLRDAKSKTGIREITGAKNHPQIVAWIKDVMALPAAEINDEIPWCAACVHGMLKVGGVAGTGKANARSYLQWGVPLLLPKMGCVAVYTRGEEKLGQGHVAFWIADFGADDLVWGGNQGNETRFALYERSRNIAYRWPKGIALP